MKKSLLILCLTFLLVGISQDEPSGTIQQRLARFNKAAAALNDAEKLAAVNIDDDETVRIDTAYKRALTLFSDPLLTTRTNDTISGISHLRKGYLLYYFDSNALAKKEFLAGVQLANKTELPPIDLFTAGLHTGAIYYSESLFDSALYYYKFAEEQAALLPQKPPGLNRLFNRIGVIYYETGNYTQAKNYFERSLSLTSVNEKDLLVNYRMNIASIEVKLEEYEAAARMYESLLPTENFENEILHNLGIIYTRLQQPGKAISLLKKVRYDDSKKTIDLYYNLALCYDALKKKDSTDYFLEKAWKENERWNGDQKNNQAGLLHQLEGDIFCRNGNYSEGIKSYQAAMISFYTDYNNAVITNNPEQFTGIFSYLNLFRVLAAKATAFKNWYNEGHDTGKLSSSVDAWRSAFLLTGFVERYYDSDEARLFLGKIKYTVHDQPIQNCIDLFELTRDEKWIEQAYLFDQWNKGSVLAYNVWENKFVHKNDTDTSLQRRAFIKSTLARLSLRALNSNDSIEKIKLAITIRDLQIELGKLQELAPASANSQVLNTIPTVTELRKRLDKRTILLSYHLSDNHLVIFAINYRQLQYVRRAIDTSFYHDVEQTKRSLYAIEPGDNHDADSCSSRLANVLLEPLNRFEGMKRLIVVPDDQLNYLPFEVLPAGDSYLIGRYSIQYQYSTALLDDDTRDHREEALGMAPFVHYRMANDSFSALPASGRELMDLKGKILLDTAATKRNFLDNVSRYPVIHLATHAYINEESPALSFISFYPGTPDHKLYAGEIANLSLEQNDLVILSACETGNGSLVKGEGLMSLSRAFASAGCSNIITSLWKAADQSTAYILQRFHVHLEEQPSIDEALRRAKLDYLSDEQVPARMKLPRYWAHLIFIGDYHQVKQKSAFYWIMGAILASGLLYIFVRRKTLLSRR